MRTENIFPTKGNLINVKKSLQLARMGYDLLDRKRNILIRELMTMIDSAKKLRNQTAISSLSLIPEPIFFCLQSITGSL